MTSANGSKAPLRILVTGAGAPGVRGTVFALRNNPDDRPVHIIGTDITNDAVGRYFVDEFMAVDPPEHPDYIPRLKNLCAKLRIDFVLPQTTREIERLSTLHENDPEFAARIAVSSGGTLARVNNKAALYEAASGGQLPLPQFRIATTKDALIRAAKDLGYPGQPVAVKPPLSNGMRGFRILKENHWNKKRFFQEKPSGEHVRLEELVAMLDDGSAWPELLVSEYLPGIEITMDAFCGRDCRVALTRHRNKIRSGISFDNSFVHMPELEERVLEFSEQAGLRYAFGFQFKQDAHGEYRLLECNPRIQGTMVASCFAGVNVIWMAVRELMGDPVSSHPPIDYGARFLRYWGGIGVVDGADGRPIATDI